MPMLCVYVCRALNWLRERSQEGQRKWGFRRNACIVCGAQWRNIWACLIFIIYALCPCKHRIQPVDLCGRHCRIWYVSQEQGRRSASSECVSTGASIDDGIVICWCALCKDYSALQQCRYKYGYKHYICSASMPLYIWEHVCMCNLDTRQIMHGITYGDGYHAIIAMYDGKWALIMLCNAQCECGRSYSTQCECGRSATIMKCDICMYATCMHSTSELCENGCM